MAVADAGTMAGGGGEDSRGEGGRLAAVRVATAGLFIFLVRAAVLAALSPGSEAGVVET
jgi:hypothetical protein